MKNSLVLFPEHPESETFRWRSIAAIWNELRVCGNTGAATWEELEPLEQQVADCRVMQPPDVKHAEALTAYALLLIDGCTEL